MEIDAADMEKRLAVLRRKMEALGPVVFGSFSEKKSTYRHSDGKVVHGKAQGVLTICGCGKTYYKRIPHSAEKKIRALVNEGAEYVKMRREYDALRSILSAEGVLKKSSSPRRSRSSRT